ncbi:hypothetical protein IE077_003722, partial [Cardiosporidium cionae]
MGKPIQLVWNATLRSLFSLYESGLLTVWTEDSTRPSPHYPEIRGAASMCIHPLKAMIAISSRNRELFLFHSNTSHLEETPSEMLPLMKRELFKKTVHSSKSKFQMAWHPTEPLLALPGEPFIRFFNASTYQLESYVLEGHE